LWGLLFLLLLVPVSEAFAKDGSGDAKQLELLFMLCKKANFCAYQIAMAVWGPGGLILS